MELAVCPWLLLGHVLATMLFRFDPIRTFLSFFAAGIREEWDCEFVRKEFPDSRIRHEGGSSDAWLSK